MSLEKFTKLTVLLSAAAALVVNALLASRDWAGLLPMTGVALLVAFVVARFSPTVASWLVLTPAYLVPVIFQIAIDRSWDSYLVIWMAAIFGMIAARGGFDAWAWPAGWKLPLAFWAMAVAISWPIIVAREADFSWAALQTNHIGNSGLGGPPSITTIWICIVSLTHLLGLLWFDWCFGAVGIANAAKFRRSVIAPLAVSVAIGCALAAYQGSIDINFLNVRQWPSLHRAGGGLLDADAFGALAGAWVAAFFALATTGAALLAAGSLVGVLLALDAAYATGSRMALVASLIALAVVAFAAIRWAAQKRTMKSLAALVVAGVIAVGVGAALMRMPTTKRYLDTVEKFPKTWTAVRPYVKNEVFDRGSPFGSSWILMMEDSPVVGIGVGTFHQMFPDYSFLVVKERHYFDNAQSWYRHQLAELGVLGSLGWLVWVFMLGWLLLTCGGDRGTTFATTAVKGALIAIFLISQVSMPTQSISVSLTVWMLTFWFLTLSPKAQAKLGTTPAAPPQWAWAVMVMLVFAFAGGTAWAARVQFRPPHRAIWANWDYVRGFSDPEADADGVKTRSASTDAVAVIFVRPNNRFLKLTFWAPQPDVTAHPLDVEFRRTGKSIGRATLTNSEPQTWYVLAPPGPRLMLEAKASRAGMRVIDWTFVDIPPRDAVIIR